MDDQQSVGGELRELALFAGAGGGILGGRLLGWRTVCAVEIDQYARDVLVARQNDGTLAPFPIWDDVRTFRGKPWRGCVDVVSGGFPCQDISVAGKGAGITGERSGLWREMARIVGEVRPSFVLVENSPALTCRGLGRVLGDLAALGYDAQWGVVSAADAIWLAGDPSVYHERKRIWIVGHVRANANSVRVAQPSRSFSDKRRRIVDVGEVACGKSADAASAGAATAQQRRFRDGAECVRSGSDADGDRRDAWRDDDAANDGRVHDAVCQLLADRDADGARLAIGQGQPGDARSQQQAAERTSWWAAEPDVGRVAHGVANRVDRLRAIGNGQVPAVARLAWLILTGQQSLEDR